MRRAVMVLVTGALLTLGLAVGSGTAHAAPVPYSSTPSNGWWVNGRVNAVEIVGGRLIVGGNFSSVVGSNGSTLARANLAAFDLGTGAPLTGFRADTNGVVHAITSVGGRVFVGGAFTSIGGQSRSRLAEVHADTGAVQSLRVGASSTVLALRPAGTGRLYVGGMFGSLGGQTRQRMGAIDLGTNGLVSGFAPTFNHHVRSIAVLGSRVFAAGQFSTVNGSTRPSLVELDGAGRLVGPRYDITDMVWDVDVSSDGTSVFAAVGGVLGQTRIANSAVAFSTSSGAWRWKVTTEGDVQAVKFLGGNVYFGFHEGYRGNLDIKLLAADAGTGAVEAGFQPPLGGFWGVWAITGDANRLVAGGEFRSLNAAARNVAVFRSGGTSPPPPSSGSTLVPMNATWRYRTYDSATASTWMQPGFNDGSWASGRAELGFGDGDEATVIPKGATIYWFRTSFNLTTVPSQVRLRMVADDGAVVYLNGREVLRDNVASGTLGSSTLAASNRSGSAETTVRSWTLSGSTLVAGTNVVAVAVYQDCACSSDLSLAAALDIP